MPIHHTFLEKLQSKVEQKICVDKMKNILEHLAVFCLNLALSLTFDEGISYDEDVPLPDLETPIQLDNSFLPNLYPPVAEDSQQMAEYVSRSIRKSKILVVYLL